VELLLLLVAIAIAYWWVFERGRDER